MGKDQPRGLALLGGGSGPGHLRTATFPGALEVRALSGFSRKGEGRSGKKESFAQIRTGGAARENCNLLFRQKEGKASVRSLAHGEGKKGVSTKEGTRLA